jgi:hypothetical protein
MKPKNLAAVLLGGLALPLLLKLTIGGETVRVSNEAADLTHFWDPYVSSAGSIKWTMAEPYGGHVKVNFSNFTLLPAVFADDWPAQASVETEILYTDSTEEAAVTLFSGTSHTAGLNRESNDYELFGEDIDSTVTDESFDDTLVNIFTTYTGASYLNLTLNTTAARSPSPAVKYTASGQLLDILSDIAKFFTHSYKITGGILYLIDMKADNGTRTFEEFDFEPVNYRDPVPISKVTGGAYSVFGSYSYGEVVDISPVCHDTQVNIETALGDIKDILEKRGAEVTLPIDTSKIPNIGEGVSWLDESFQNDINMNIRVNGIVYNFDSYSFTVTGFGEIS